MHIARSFLLLMTCADSGIVLVLSCGDNLSVKASADAAIDAPQAPDTTPTCDCPAAEPPLANRWVEYGGIHVLDPDAEGNTTVYCKENERLISGGCAVLAPLPYQDVILRESGFVDAGTIDLRLAWRCSFRNTGTIQIYYRITAMCLKPAP